MIRFRRFEHHTIKPASSLRLKASERALKKQRDTLPLFATQIAAKQPTAEERIRNIDYDFKLHWLSIRVFHATLWKKGRKILRSWPDDIKTEALQKWNTSRCPGDSAYFCDFLRQFAKAKGFCF